MGPVRVVAILENVVGAFRVSLRRQRARPGVAVVVVATLALGIGANTAMWSVVDAVLLRPLAYRDAGRLLALFTHETSRGNRRNPSSPADFLQWKEGSRTLQDLTAAHPWSPVLSGRGRPEPIPALKATAGLFDLLGAAAFRGRAFSAEDPAGENVVVLSHRLWQRRFGGDPAIVGQTLVLDGQPYLVSAVMPEGFRFPPFWATEAEMWTPLRFTAEDTANDARFLRVFARLRPSATIDEARAEMEAIAHRQAVDRPAAHTGFAINVEGLREPVVSRVRPALLMLLGAVGFVLLIACANVASLLLAEGQGREKEMAVRASLGASRARLVGEVLADSLVLAFLGGGFGLLVASAGIEALRVLGPEGLPRIDELRLDPRLAAFALLASTAAGVLAGALPAWRAAKRDPGPALKGGDRVAGRGPHRLHDSLVVAQCALAFVLLVGAGLTLRAFAALLRPSAGFRTEGVLTMNLSFPPVPRGAQDERPAFRAELLTEVRALPGVAEAALVNHLPIAGDTWGTAYLAEGEPPSADEPPSAVIRVATPGYLRAMGIPLRQGRDFDDRDRAEAEGVALVNETLARRAWPGVDPLGRRLRTGGPESPGPFLTVVGVFADAAQASLTDPIRPEIVRPFAQDPTPWFRSATLVVGSRTADAVAAEPVTAKVWSLDPDLPVTRVRTMAVILGEALREQKLGTGLLGLFAGSALLLAAVGLYGLMAHRVAQQAREIALRMALGAPAAQVFRRVLARGLLLGAAGVGLGFLAARALAHALAAWVHGVSPTDPATYAVIPVLLLTTCAAASAAPAWRASRTDPLVILREG